MPKGEHNTSWERLDRKTVLNSKFMSVYVDTVKLPNGSIIDDYSVVSLPSGVIVVATDIEGRLIAQYEYKYAIDKTILNLPSGSVENGMSPVDVAKNELKEETGYVSDEFELVRTLYEYPSKADHIIYIVRAKNVRRELDVDHEETETISGLMAITPEERRKKGEFDTTYNLSALAVTLPEYI